MPKFLTISPTDVPNKKEYAWNNFRSRYEYGYVAIGWLREHNLTGKSLEEIIDLIKEHKYRNEKSAIYAHKQFHKLDIGDYVAVNNGGHGLFGIGVVDSPYKYEEGMHDSGNEDASKFYSHFRKVKWIYTSYAKQKDIIRPGEKSFRPFGTVGKLEEHVPPYIQRLTGSIPGTIKAQTKYVVPEEFKGIVESIKRLREEPKHPEVAHENLVIDLLSALGWEMHREIKLRQKGADISLCEGNTVHAIVEVKSDWKMNSADSSKTLKQAYFYALEQGACDVVLTNGDWYALYDRTKGLNKGLKLEENSVGQFQLTALEEKDEALIQWLTRENVLKRHRDNSVR